MALRCTAPGLASAAAALAVFATSPRARGTEPEAVTERPESSNVTTPFDRPHTVAELEAGIIALPNAPISASERGGNTPIFGKVGNGDATIQTGLHLLYRASPEFAVGAGFMFAPSPTSDTGYGIGGLQGLKRTHSRSYLTLAAEGRYVPLRTRSVEGWAGVTAGGVVIADRFTTDEGPAVPEVLGRKDYSLRTEGFALGFQVGVTWMFAERWIAGFALRADQWILPNSPQCSPIGDCTTLTGTVAAFEAGLAIGYRIPL